MSISFKNTKYHTFSPSGTTTKIAEELSVSPLAIFLSQIWRLFGVIFPKSAEVIPISEMHHIQRKVSALLVL